MQFSFTHALRQQTLFSNKAFLNYKIIIARAYYIK